MDDERLNRHALPDAEWALLGSLLPRHPRQGRRWNDHRVVIAGVFHRARAGCPWRDLPERFGDWKTVYNPHRRWSRGGTWGQGLGGLRARGHQAGGPARAVGRRPTVVPPPPPPAPAPATPPRPPRP